MTILNPYLSFNGNARTAMEFYRGVFGGELEVMTFAGMEGMGIDPDEVDLAMHAQLTTAEGLTLMASDTPRKMNWREPVGMQVSVSGDDEATLRGYWDALADGATVTMPLGPPPWGGLFGMLKDQFGVEWMVSIDTAS